MDKKAIWQTAKKEVVKEAGVEGVKQLVGYLLPGITLGSIMSAAAQYAQWWWPWVVLSGIAVFVVVTLTLASYKRATADSSSEHPLAVIEPQHLIFVGLAGIIISAVITFAGFVWQMGASPKHVKVAADVKQTTPLSPASEAPPASIPQLARLRVRYTPASPAPEIIETDNVLKPMSFQFADDGSASDPKAGRAAKWTLLALTFDKPVTGENLRVLFEGGDVPYEKKTFTSRNVSILFTGAMADKTIQIEVRP
jgi:hypothetical protein